MSPCTVQRTCGRLIGTLSFSMPGKPFDSVSRSPPSTLPRRAEHGRLPGRPSPRVPSPRRPPGPGRTAAGRSYASDGVRAAAACPVRGWASPPLWGGEGPRRGRGGGARGRGGGARENEKSPGAEAGRDLGRGAAVGARGAGAGARGLYDPVGRGDLAKRRAAGVQERHAWQTLNHSQTQRSEGLLTPREGALPPSELTRTSAGVKRQPTPRRDWGWVGPARGPRGVHGGSTTGRKGARTPRT